MQLDASAVPFSPGPLGPRVLEISSTRDLEYSRSRVLEYSGPGPLPHSGRQRVTFAPKGRFPPQSAFLGPKCVFAPQNAFWGQKGSLPLFGPLGRVENHYSYKGLGPAGATGAPRRERCDFLAFRSFWRPKVVFGAQNAFLGPKRNFPRRAQKHTFSVWFLAHFGGRWGPECVFCAK